MAPLFEEATDADMKAAGLDILIEPTTRMVSEVENIMETTAGSATLSPTPQVLINLLSAHTIPHIRQGLPIIQSEDINGRSEAGIGPRDCSGIAVMGNSDSDIFALQNFSSSDHVKPSDDNLAEELLHRQLQHPNFATNDARNIEADAAVIRSNPNKDDHTVHTDEGRSNEYPFRGDAETLTLTGADACVNPVPMSPSSRPAEQQEDENNDSDSDMFVPQRIMDIDTDGDVDEAVDTKQEELDVDSVHNVPPFRDIWGAGTETEPINLDDDEDDNEEEGMSVSSDGVAPDESSDYQPEYASEIDDDDDDDDDDDPPSPKRQSATRKKVKSAILKSGRLVSTPITKSSSKKIAKLTQELKKLDHEKQGLMANISNLSAEELLGLRALDGRIGKMQAKLETLREVAQRGNAGFKASEKSDTTGQPYIPRKGERAKTSREWWARENESRKNVIEKKRRILHQEPVASERAPTKRPKNKTKYVNRMEDGAEQVQKKGTLSVAKLQYSNPMQARMARSDVVNPEGFKAATKGQHLQYHKENVPEGCDPKAVKADLQKLDRASKTFGDRKCKAVNDQWALDGMKTLLYNHQVLGASWMLGREFSEDRGGVNADEMGLGKTIQTLATIVNNPPTKTDLDQGRRVTLIVVPSSVLDQWMKEIRAHTDPERLKHIHHYKASRNDDLVSLRNKDILVTTYYEVLAAYLPKQVRLRIESRECSSEEKETLREEHLGFLFKIPFHRVVLDEAHAIKDPTTQTSIACRNLEATYRWALTGTPIQNTTEEIWPYLAFLQVDWAKTRGKFRQLLGSLDQAANKKQFETIVRTVFQRRTMNDTFLGKRLYSIPECYEEVISFPLTKEESIIYRAVEKRFRDIINHKLRKLRRSGRKVKLKDLELYIVFLTRLRQGTAHPFLLEAAMKSPMRVEDLEAVKRTLAKVGGKTRVIDQIREWRSKYTTDIGGDSNETERFGLGDFGGELNMDKHMQIAIANKTESVCNICFGFLTRPRIADCGHIFCTECIGNEVLRAVEEDREDALCPKCDKPLKHTRPQCEDASSSFSSSSSDDDDASSIRTGISSTPLSQKMDDMIGFQKYRKMKARMRKDQKFTVKDDNYRVLGNDMLNVQPRLKKENTMFLRDSDKRWPEPMVPSAKTTMVKDITLKWQKEAPDDKIIIFTQFLEESVIIGRMLQAENIGFLYFYGSMSQKKKTRALDNLRKESDMKVLVASLKCGGVGLNITCANRVIITDPWWNASIELQAYARVFRIGQQKKTYFVSLLAENTVDARIASLQAEKLKNIEQAMQHSKTPTFEEMASLLGHLTEDEYGNLMIEADYRD